jgi:hypothetical protein
MAAPCADEWNNAKNYLVRISTVIAAFLVFGSGLILTPRAVEPPVIPVGEEAYL